MIKTDLKPGDILLLKDTPDHTSATHKLIKLGQKFRGKGGSSEFVHALVWVKNQATIGMAEPEIAEASGSGIVRCSTLNSGHYTVFRPTDDNLGDWAAQVAMMWGIDGNIKYGKVAAGGSIIHSHSFGKHGQARAAEYGRLAFTNPQGNNGELSDMFCSQFVIAVYQAAAKNTGGATIPLDAKHCSPQALYQYLIQSGNFTANTLNQA